MNDKHVRWRDAMKSHGFAETTEPLSVPLGTTADGTEAVADLHLLRHMLVCGIAGTGKSALVHAILNSLLMRRDPQEMSLVIIDPKQVEYQAYETLPHLLAPVISDTRKAIVALKWLAKESDRRLGILRRTKTRRIDEYHGKIARRTLRPVRGVFPERMPYLIVVIDEFSIPMAAYPKEIEGEIMTIARTARETGIHLIVTTTQLDSRALPVVLRDHFAARVTFHVSAAQSRMLVGNASAATLDRAGAAIFRANAMKKSVYINVPFITESEIDANMAAIAKKYPKAALDASLIPADEYWSKSQQSVFLSKDGEPLDELYDDAVAAVRAVGKASIAYLQRKLGIGYARAAKLMDLLEKGGIIGPQNGNSPRQTLDDDEWLFDQ